MSIKTKICFHVLNAYSLFDKTTAYPYGGAELRASIFAKELAKDKSIQVDFITLYHGQRTRNIDDVNLIADSLYADDNMEYKPRLLSFFQRVKYFFYRIIGKNSIDYLRMDSLKSSNGDFYLVFGISGLNKRVVDFCLKENKKLIFFFASDEELNITTSNFLELKHDLISYFINNSYLIFCQNQFQKSNLNEHFHRDGILLLNPIQINVDFIDKSVTAEKKIIWIGKSNKVKNPFAFIELAKLNPDKAFIMLCNKSDLDMHLKVIQSVPSNVTLIENAGINEVENILKDCHILVSTSFKEGFPNVFLQAGKHSMPVISADVDPNNYIKDFECGYVTSNAVEELDKKLKIIYNDRDIFKKAAANHYNYVKKFHSSVSVIEKFKLCLSDSAA